MEENKKQLYGDKAEAICEVLEKLPKEEVTLIHASIAGCTTGEPNALSVYNHYFPAAQNLGDYYRVQMIAYDYMSEIDQKIADKTAEQYYNSGARLPKIHPVAAMRLDRGMSQAALAEKSGINIRQLQRIENGESKLGNITLRNALALADALGIDAASLFAASELGRTGEK